VADAAARATPDSDVASVETLRAEMEEDFDVLRDLYGHHFPGA
jgi:hypothetical protein